MMSLGFSILFTRVIYCLQRQKSFIFESFFLLSFCPDLPLKPQRLKTQKLPVDIFLNKSSSLRAGAAEFCIRSTLRLSCDTRRASNINHSWFSSVYRKAQNDFKRLTFSAPLARNVSFYREGAEREKNGFSCLPFACKLLSSFKWGALPFLTARNAQMFRHHVASIVT